MVDQDSLFLHELTRALSITGYADISDGKDRNRFSWYPDLVRPYFRYCSLRAS